MRKAIEADLQVACPLCKARPGKNCVSTGQRGFEMLNVVHRERRREAQRGV